MLRTIYIYIYIYIYTYIYTYIHIYIHIYIYIIHKNHIESRTRIRAPPKKTVTFSPVLSSSSPTCLGSSCKARAHCATFAQALITALAVTWLAWSLWRQSSWLAMHHHHHQPTTRVNFTTHDGSMVLVFLC